MDWTRGYSARWRVRRVDPRTWADAEELGGVTAVGVERDWTSPTLERGRMTVDGAGDFAPGYYRVALWATQDGATERMDVATLLCEATRTTSDRGGELREVVGHSVLRPAETERLAGGSYAPSGADGAAYAAGMLRAVLAAPVTVEGRFVLGQNVVWDAGTPVLDAVRAVLDAGGFCLRLSGDGSVAVRRRPTTPALALDDAGARLMHPGVTHDLDLSGVPNRYFAAQGALLEVAVNDDPDSPTSTAARGYNVDAYDGRPVRVDGETLYGYCVRCLREESTVGVAHGYSREWWPDVTVGDVVHGSLASVGMVGDLRITRQSLACGHGISVTEQAEEEVSLWQS